MPTSRPLPILRPERLRQLPRSFAWLDHRLRTAGFLQLLSPADLSLYCFLALAADKGGLSCWRLDRMERELPFDAATLRQSRDHLTTRELIAYRPWRPECMDGSYQMLALPTPPIRAAMPSGAQLGDILAGLNLGKP